MSEIVTALVLGSVIVAGAWATLNVLGAFLEELLVDRFCGRMPPRSRIPHYHCPNECEKPQPYQSGPDPDRYFCGRCWFEGRGRVEMLECTPATCPDEVPDV